jgi:SNF2 family DNA or RNA helicase
MTTKIFDITFYIKVNDMNTVNVDVYSFDDINTYFKISYDNISVIKNYNFSSDKSKQTILLEILNKSKLWVMTHNNDHDYIQCNINIVDELIDSYLDSSIGLYYLIISRIKNNYTHNIKSDITNISYIPKNSPVEPPPSFKVKLHKYQKKNLARMLEIEDENYHFKIKNIQYVSIGTKKIMYDPTYCKINSSDKDTDTITIKSNGGILADEMGLGKTITCAALIAKKPYVPIPNTYLKDVGSCKKIISKATVIICPSHLLSQWKSELLKCCPHFKILVISTKTDYKELIFNDFINVDIIITSYQFLMNFSFYPSLYYRYCTASNYDFKDKTNMTQSSLLSILETDNTFEKLKNHDTPIFEFFSFHRLILDETHEIFGNMLSNQSQSIYMSKWVTQIDANYYWYVSGTPFINYQGMVNCGKYIKLELNNNLNNKLLFVNINNYNNTNTYYDKIINTESFWDTILNNLCIRHRKKDVEDQINIIGYQEKLVWVKLTDTEKQLYNAKKSTVCPTELQQLCCHPLILDSARKIIGSLEEVDLDVIKSKLIDHHKSNLSVYTDKIKLLDKTKPEYAMVSSNYNRIISESRFILAILEKIDNPNILSEESCSICMDCLDNPTLTSCGHMYCYDCIKMCLSNVKKCPMCKQDLEGKELIKIINQPKEEKVVQQDNVLIEKYGSKLGKLISIIRCLTTRNDTRIIIFSQWDNMLSLIGKTLIDNDISNSFVKGNVWSRNAAIRRFKSGDENKVIMLSLKNAASGTNLTEATHIFFVEPINVPRNESSAIEGQAIARACRIGQKQQVLILRVLIEDTIEQDIYEKYYDSNVVVANEEKDYFVNMNLEYNNDATNTNDTTNDDKKKVVRRKKTTDTDATDEKKKVVRRKKTTDATDEKKKVVRKKKTTEETLTDNGSDEKKTVIKKSETKAVKKQITFISDETDSDTDDNTVLSGTNIINDDTETDSD